MNQAPLLGAVDRVVGGVKVRDQDSLEILQGRLHGASLAVLAVNVDYLFKIAEHPDKCAFALRYDGRLVSMNERSLYYPPKQYLAGFLVQACRHLFLLCHRAARQR